MNPRRVAVFRRRGWDGVPTLAYIAAREERPRVLRIIRRLLPALALLLVVLVGALVSRG